MSFSAKKMLFSVGLFLIVLVLPLSVFFLQQQQNVKSRAATGDVIGDSHVINSSVSGSVIGNSNKINGAVGGDVIGDNNTIIGNVTGCVVGTNNVVQGSVGRQVVGSNQISGTVGSGLCLSAEGNLSPTGVINTLTPTPVISSSLTATPTVSSTLTPSATLAPSVSPQPVSFSLELFLHGIGNSGDNANPNTYSLSNKQPVHTNQPATIAIFDRNNTQVGNGSGDLLYSTGTGSYKGTVNLNASVIDGEGYTIKVKTVQHLFKLIPGIQTIKIGQTNVIPAVHLVAGDVNNDNKLNILDYNLLLNCYSDLTEAVGCN